ncbi:hypothetical protein PO477_24095 [Enterobacter hormaechei]
MQKTNRRQSGGNSQRRVFSVCEYHSLCWRHVLRPS